MNHEERWTEIVERAGAFFYQKGYEATSLQDIGRWMALEDRDREWGLVAEREFMRLSKRRLRKIIERRDRFSNYVKDIIRQGVDGGAFDPDTDE